MKFYNDPTGNRTRVTAVKGPCLNRLTIGPYYFLRSSPSRVRTYDPPVNSRMLYRWAIEDHFYFVSGSHLLSRAVSSQVSSAACVLTVVFGMGTGVSHRRIATGNFMLFQAPSKPNMYLLHQFYHTSFLWSSPRPISISKLNTLLCVHLWPIYLVVFKGSYFFRMGNLILRAASRLDAFSVYPFRT